MDDTNETRGRCRTTATSACRCSEDLTRVRRSTSFLIAIDFDIAIGDVFDKTPSGCDLGSLLGNNNLTDTKDFTGLSLDLGRTQRAAGPGQLGGGQRRGDGAARGVRPSHLPRGGRSSRRGGLDAGGVA